MKKIKLTDIAPYSGKRVQPFDGVKRYMSTGDLKGDNLSFEDVTYQSKPSRADIIVSEGDILFAKMTNTNKALQIDKELEGIIVSTGFSVHRPLENELFGEYFLHFLKHNIFQRQKNKLCTGAIQSAISNSGIEKIFVPVPDYNDQLHIANILSKAENLIAQRKESIRLLDEFLKSTFLEMFGDPGINPKKWPVKKLEDYIEYMGDIGSNGSNEMVAKNLEMLDEEDYAIMIRTTNLTRNDFKNNIKYVTKKTYDFFKKSKIYGGEIIMNKIGSAGDFWLMPNLNRPVTLGLNQLVIRPKNMPTLFLFHYLSTDYGKMIVKAQCKGATTKSITKTAVKALPIIVPPFELQTKFAQIVEKTEALKTQYQQSLQELENLYGSLSQKAFRGE
ncbi:MAG TPA: restriction endonuclease subunit S [Saprospiraceae bacterium]|nr:restriction endonuclease subunit S [Saprospiraceae bacterium]